MREAGTVPPGEGPADGERARPGVCSRDGSSGAEYGPRQQLCPGRLSALLAASTEGAEAWVVFHSCHGRDLFSPWTGISFFVSQIQL